MRQWQRPEGKSGLLNHNTSNLYRDQYSPQLKEKQSNPVKGFYTPNLMSKDINTIQNHNAYLKSKYGQMGNLENRKPLFSDVNQIQINNKENHNPENSDAVRNTEEEKKIAKISMLFIKDLMDKVNVDSIVHQWFNIIQIVGESNSVEEYIKYTATLLKGFRIDVVDLFINGFSNYNEVRSRVSPHFKLEIWTLITALTVFQSPQYRENIKVYQTLDLIYGELLKSSYYLTLMFSKAVKYNCLTIDSNLINEFNKKVQKFKFETGIPLIKTLKINNDEATRNLSMILEVVKPSLINTFEESLAKSFESFEVFIRFITYDKKSGISNEIKDLLHESVETFSPLQSLKLRVDENLNGNSVVSSPVFAPSPVPHTAHGMQKSSTHYQSPVIKDSLRHFNLEKTSEKSYVLVLDLDETLVHFKNESGKARFLVRPHAYNFLKNMSSHFEIIIFTAAQKDYADWILDKIDTKSVISHRLYRDHCDMSERSHIKVS